VQREKYYCVVTGCKRGMDGGRHFGREDNCRKHVRLVHGKLGAGVAVGMDEVTRGIRRERRLGRKRVATS